MKGGGSNGGDTPPQMQRPPLSTWGPLVTASGPPSYHKKKCHRRQPFYLFTCHWLFITWVAFSHIGIFCRCCVQIYLYIHRYIQIYSITVFFFLCSQEKNNPEHNHRPSRYTNDFRPGLVLLGSPSPTLVISYLVYISGLHHYFYFFYFLTK